MASACQRSSLTGVSSYGDVHVPLPGRGGEQLLLLLPRLGLRALLQSAFKSRLGLLSAYFIHSPNSQDKFPPLFT